MLLLGAQLQASAIQPVPASPAAALAILPLTVNTVARGETLALLEGNDAFLRVADLVSAGLKEPGGTRRDVEGEAYVSLASLAPDVAWNLDEKALRLDVTVAPRLLGRSELNLQPASRPPGILAPKTTSGFVNYSLSIDDRGLASGLNGLAGFAEGGLSVHGALLYGAASRLPDGTLLRGSTNLTVDDTSRMVRWVAGDTYLPGTSLAGGAMVGGVSVSRRFDLDPYFYRYPGVGVSGEATTPSRADIYVNGLLVRQVQLPPGPFSLSDLPVLSGTGETRVVLRDAFGAERVLSSPYYFSTNLLAPGLSEFSYSVGFRRGSGLPRGTDGSSGWNGLGLDYGEPLFAGRHRVGITQKLTAEAWAQAAKGLVNGGAGLSTNAGFATLEASAAASRAGGEAGWAGSLGASWLGRRFSLGAFLRGTSPRFATLAVPAETDRVVREFGGALTFLLRGVGTVSLQYASRTRRDGAAGGASDGTVGCAGPDGSGATERALSARLNAQVAARVSLNLSAERSLRSDGRSSRSATTLFASLLFLLGTRSSADVAWSHDDGRAVLSASAQSPVPTSNGFGYRVQASATEGSANGRATAMYQGPWGLYEASYARTIATGAAPGATGSAGPGTASLFVSGGLAFIGGSVHPTRAIREGFALVRVPGVAGVRAFAQNSEVGRTDRGGDVLVPDLVPHYGNFLGIADVDVPIGFEIDAAPKLVAPAYRGGALVEFRVRRLRAFTGSIAVSFRGTEVVPAYGQIHVAADGQEFASAIGGKGDFYLEDVPPGARQARVLYLGAACLVTLHLPESAEPVADLGNIVCRADVSSPSPAP